MSYHNGDSILPMELITEIQKYIDGVYLYIPRKAGNRKSWGEVNHSRNRNCERNAEIFRRYHEGVSVKELSRLYFLSEKTIYSILSKLKNQ